jgi:hypothetical protein
MPLVVPSTGWHSQGQHPWRAPGRNYPARAHPSGVLTLAVPFQLEVSCARACHALLPPAHEVHPTQSCAVKAVYMGTVLLGRPAHPCLASHSCQWMPPTAPLNSTCLLLVPHLVVAKHPVLHAITLLPCLPLPLITPGCRRWSGELHGAEGQQLAWVAASKLSDYPMPAADIPLVPAVAAACQAAAAPAQ